MLVSLFATVVLGVLMLFLLGCCRRCSWKAVKPSYWRPQKQQQQPPSSSTTNEPNIAWYDDRPLVEFEELQQYYPEWARRGVSLKTLCMRVTAAERFDGRHVMLVISERTCNRWFSPNNNNKKKAKPLANLVSTPEHIVDVISGLRLTCGDAYASQALKERVVITMDVSKLQPDAIAGVRPLLILDETLLLGHSQTPTQWLLKLNADLELYHASPSALPRGALLLDQAQGTGAVNLMIGCRWFNSVVLALLIIFMAFFFWSWIANA